MAELSDAVSDSDRFTSRGVIVPRRMVLLSDTVMVSTAWMLTGFILPWLDSDKVIVSRPWILRGVILVHPDSDIVRKSAFDTVKQSRPPDAESLADIESCADMINGDILRPA